MGRVFLIGVVVMTLILAATSVKMNKAMEILPDVTTSDLSKKETQNMMNYAIRYGLRNAEERQFPKQNGFKYTQRFNNFFYRYGYIDSIKYEYVESSSSFRITPYVRTQVNGRNSQSTGKAGIRDISIMGGKGNVAHWSMDYNLLDASANSNDGIGYGGVRFQNNGLSNACVFPDGRQDYILFDDTPSLDLPEQFSFAFWGNWNSDPNGWIPFFWKPLPSSNANYMIHPAWGLWIYQDYLYGGFTTQNGTYLQVVSNVQIKPQGTWHLVALTYGNNSLKLYYDAVCIASASVATGPLYNSDQSLCMGRRIANDCGTVYFKGRLDELAIYDYILTDTQISSIYNSPNGILPVGNGNPRVEYIKE